jgi:hypothetical protein
MTHQVTQVTKPTLLFRYRKPRPSLTALTKQFDCDPRFAKNILTLSTALWLRRKPSVSECCFVSIFRVDVVKNLQQTSFSVLVLTSLLISNHAAIKD